MSSTMETGLPPASIAKTHYNNWPNTAGFDATYEEHMPIDLVVKGTIPSYAAGTLFRTAIGPRSVKNDQGKVVYRTNHWFDGFAQLHRFQLHAPSNASGNIERITYNSRLMCDRLLTRIQKTGRWDEYTFAAKYEPCRSLFQKIQSFFEKAPVFEADEVINAVTISLDYPGFPPSTISQGVPSPDDNDKNSSPPTNKIVTACNKTDASRLQFFDPETLQPVGLAYQTKLHPDLKGPLSAAHSATDPATNETFNYNMDFTGAQATYRVFKTSSVTGKTSIITTIRHSPAYLHSSFLTENFFILCIWNSHFNLAGVSMLWARNVLDAMYYNDKASATWYVIDRREGGRGVVAKLNSDPFFCFHTANAYEVPNSDGVTTDIVCDLLVYNDLSVLHALYMDSVLSDSPTAQTRARETLAGQHQNTLARLRRYKLSNVPLPSSPSSSPLNPPTALIEFTAPASVSPELPTIHPSYMGKPYRYVYGVMGSDGTKSTFVHGLLKFDLQTQTTITWQEDGQTPGEAIFVPKPADDDNAGEEDDGVLLSVILDGYTEKSYLLCLDAKDLTELGRAEVDGVIGFGYHGIHTSSL